MEIWNILLYVDWASEVRKIDAKFFNELNGMWQMKQVP